VKDAFLWGRAAALPALTPARAERLCRDAAARRPAAAARDNWTASEGLHRAGRLWADPAGPFRRRAQALMPRATGFSPATVRATLELIPHILERRALRLRLRAELGREDALDVWRSDPEGGGALKALPLGAVLHVAAGNIFLGCIDSAVMSLLTNNVTLLRTSAADPGFPLLFAESLRRAAPELARDLAVLSWPSGDAEVEGVFKNRLDGVVVWGGEAAVAAYRQGLGPGCRLVPFGPKLSFGVVSRAGLRRVGVREAARRAARDVAWWDQNACASPQTLFVQGPRDDAFLEALAAELRHLARSFPAGTPSPDAAASAVEERHRALAAELTGRGRLLAAGDGSWSVAWRQEPALRASPLNRFLQVSPYRDAAHLAELVRPAAAFLQTAGLLVGSAEEPAYAETLAAAGAARLPALGSMLEARTGEPHDGRYPLSELVRWVVGPESAATDGAKALRSLRAQAVAESPFYAKRLRARGALTDKADLARHSPPGSEALLTRAGDGEGRLVFASGGSTGAPKFSLYTQREFSETCRWLAMSLRQAGLAPGDVAANLFVAGNLWSSFMAVSEAARQLGVTLLPVAGTSDPAFTLAALKRFKADALIGLPSTILDLADRPEARALRVKKVFYGGEHASDAMRKAWREKLGAGLIRSAGYASVDAGLIGFQCADCPGTVHHAAAGLQHVEIVDSEIVATNLVRRWMPVIRYRTGDRGRWLKPPCPCGHPAPLFELLGRMDDRVNVGGAHVDAGDVARAVADVPGLSPVFQLRVAKGERLTVAAELKDARRPEGAARLLSAALLRRSAELADSVKRGWLATPSVALLPPGGIPRLPRTGKVRRVVDSRF
jgi:phenylacetate-coenzyme A ligase PaaK-like adenylate-forming protein